MNNPHVHLLLNHVPTIGTVIAFGLLILSFIRRDEGLKRVSLEVFFVVAVLTLPAYISGVGTEFTFETNESISKELVSGATWVWPTSEALHFIGLWLLFGILLIANLRLMGMMRAIPFSAVHRLLPWAALGLVLNTITGMGWVLAAANQYVENYSFFWKIGLLLLAELNLLYITVFDGPWKVGAHADSPVLQRAFAVTAVGLWIGVMYFGRMLPFLGNAF